MTGLAWAEGTAEAEEEAEAGVTEGIETGAEAEARLVLQVTHEHTARSGACGVPRGSILITNIHWRNYQVIMLAVRAHQLTGAGGGIAALVTARAVAALVIKQRNEPSPFASPSSTCA